MTLQMPELRLYLFGLPRIMYQGNAVKIERRKALALAAYLALGNHQQSRDVLVDLLWPELDYEHGRSALRSTLRALTTAINAEWIEADRTTVTLNRDAVWVDVHAFTDLLSASGSHGHRFDVTCADCVTLYQQANGIYQSDFMAGFTLSDSAPYDDWQLSQREWLRREWVDMLRRMADYYEESQKYSQALKFVQKWLAADPLHEQAHRQLMRLYAVQGQRADALRHYQHVVTLLDSELATPPEDETIELFETISSGQFAQPQMLPTIDISVSSVLPALPSLVIGREDALADIKRHLGIGSGETRAMTVVQGWPGVGKSTIVALLAHDRDVAQHFPDGVVWVSLGENPEILAGLLTWAEAFKLNEPGRARKAEDMSALLTATLREQRVLLIVDDVWQTEHVQPFRVGGQMCALVITSRMNDVATALAPTASDVYRLPLLTDKAALELLSKLTPETTLKYPNESRELVRDLEGLPLAINVAGRLLHSEARLGWGVADLLNELRTGVRLLQAQAPSDMPGQENQPSPTVAALLNRSTDLLDNAMRRCFAYLGLFVPKPATFDLEAMAVVWDVDDAKPVARVLVSRGLLEPISGGRFQMHALLVLHARALLDEEGLE